MKIKCSVICLISSIFISISTNSNYKCSKAIENIVNDEIIRHNGNLEHRSHSFYGPILYLPSIDAEPVEVE